MSSLDKDMLFYFRDEIEKQALIVPALIGFGKIVAGAAKGAAQGAGMYAKGLTRLSGAFQKGPLRTRDYIIGGGGGTVATIMAGKSGLKKAKEVDQINKSLGPVQESGLQTFSGGY